MSTALVVSKAVNYSILLTYVTGSGKSDLDLPRAAAAASVPEMDCIPAAHCG